MKQRIQVIKRPMAQCKKLIFLLSLLLLPLLLLAQTNPKAGCVLTVAGDTICGTIDYLSDTRNAKVCLFKPDGQELYQRLTTDELQAWWLQSGGIYYVRRTFPVDGQQTTFFAEFLLKGGVSLYHHTENEVDYYYSVDEQGHVATLKKRSYVNLNSEKEREDAKRRDLAEMYAMIQQSSEATEALWRSNELSSRTLTRIVRRYNEQYCTDAGECVAFQYDSRQSRSQVTHFRAEAGFTSGTLKTNDVDGNGTKYEYGHCSTALIGLGIDIALPRMSRQLYIQGMLYASKWNAENHDTYYNHSITAFDISLQVAPVYRFLPDAALTPFLKAGLSFNILATHIKKDGDPYDNPSMLNTGIVIGGGLEGRIGSHRLSISATYDPRRLLLNSRIYNPQFTTTVGFTL